MDMHVVRWGITVAIVVSLLCIVYMYMNYMGQRRPSATVSVSASSPDGWTVYGSNKCSWTRKQTDEMDAKGLKYTFVDCDTDDCPGVSGFPTLKHDDGTVKVGYTPM
jgi:hypothetical protein